MFAARFRFCFAFGTIAAIVAAGAAPEHARLAAAPNVTTVAWSPCHRDLGLPFECGQVQVPLDHDDPGGAAISIALVRLPAADPTRRIGSLFLNPGGPGGPASISRCLADQFSSGASCGARFDLVGFDPRGIARSTALRCFGTSRQWFPFFTPFAFPVTRRRRGGMGGERSIPRRRLRATRLPDHRPHGDGRRGARPRPAPAGGG